METSSVSSIIKTVCYYHMNGKHECNRTETPELDPNTYGNLGYDKDGILNQ